MIRARTPLLTEEYALSVPPPLGPEDIRPLVRARMLFAELRWFEKRLVDEGELVV